MKKAVILLTALTFSFLQAQEEHKHVITDVQQFAHAWANACIAELNQDELELVGTFLYYDVAASHYEIVLRSTLMDLQRGSQLLAFKMTNQPDATNTLALCEQLGQLLESLESEIIPSRNYFLAAWQRCAQEINECPYQHVMVVIEQLQMLGQRSLENWATTNTRGIQKLLTETDTTLANSIVQLTLYKNTFAGIAQGNNPIPCETEFTQVHAIDTCLALSSAVNETLFNTGSAIDQVSGMALDLINVNSSIFTALYTAFYQALEAHQLLPMPLVVNDKGFIPLRERTIMLPDLQATV